MIPEKILSKKAITMSESKEILKERVKEKEEPSYEQDMSLKYIERFAKLTPAKAEKLVSELIEIEGVDDVLAVKIADVLPATMEVLQLLLQKNAKIKEADHSKIFELVKKYQK